MATALVCASATKADSTSAVVDSGDGSSRAVTPGPAVSAGVDRGVLAPKGSGDLGRNVALISPMPMKKSSI